MSNPRQNSFFSFLHLDMSLVNSISMVYSYYWMRRRWKTAKAYEQRLWTLTVQVQIQLCALAVWLWTSSFASLGLRFLSFFREMYFRLRWASVAVHRLSLVAENRDPGSSSCGDRLSRATACRIFPNQGSNPHPLHGQADSQLPDHQGRLSISYLYNRQGGHCASKARWRSR